MIGDAIDAKDAKDASRGLLEARLAAAVVIGLGLLALFGATQVGAGAGYVAVGPSLMPTVIGVGLVALGALLLLRATVRPDLDLAGHVAADAALTDWPTTGLTLAALVAYALTLGPLGYVLATTWFIPVVARILGSRRPVRDLVVGVAIGIVVYVAFTQFLGVRLPAGLLDPVLP
jgi:putative tricarboxylic transport membrane protein